MNDGAKELLISPDQNPKWRVLVFPGATVIAM